MRDWEFKVKTPWQQDGNGVLPHVIHNEIRPDGDFLWAIGVSSKKQTRQRAGKLAFFVANKIKTESSTGGADPQVTGLETLGIDFVWVCVMCVMCVFFPGFVSYVYYLIVFQLEVFFANGFSAECIFIDAVYFIIYIAIPTKAPLPMTCWKICEIIEIFLVKSVFPGKARETGGSGQSADVYSHGGRRGRGPNESTEWLSKRRVSAGETGGYNGRGYTWDTYTWCIWYTWYTWCTWYTRSSKE